MLGDRNTKFFLACASQRHKKNVLREVQNLKGQVVSTPEEINTAFCECFSYLFQTSNPTQEAIAICIYSVKPKVTAEMNEEELQKQFTRDEIQQAIKQMAPLKSLGPYGFNACFYQTYWINFTYNGVFDKKINFTYALSLFPNSKTQ